MSNAPPARIASFETVATTSPVECCARTAGPERGSVVADHLGEPERRLQPVGDRGPVAHHAGGGLHGAEAEQDAGPERERARVVVDDPLLDRTPDRERHQRLRDHPHDPEHDPEDERADLVPADPDEQARRGARVRLSRVVHRQPDHGSILATGVGRAQVVSTVIDQTMSASGRVA